MNKAYRITLIPGETVGPELMRQAEKALYVLQRFSDADFILERPVANSASVDNGGPPLPGEAERVALESQAIMYGTLAAKKYLPLKRNERPEYSMNILRDKLGIYCNVRRIFLPKRLKSRSLLKNETPFDIVCVRDLSCGLSSANTVRKTWRGPNGMEAVDEEYINERAAERCGRLAFETAMLRRKKLLSLDKASLNDTSVLWRAKMDELSREYPEVELTHEYIDTAAMEVIHAPQDIDVIVTMGAYGDIIMDELTALSGVASILGSAELAEDKRGIYTPNFVHCPNEWMAGLGVVYPICIIDALALMLEHSLGRTDLACAVRLAAQKTIESGIYTKEIWREGDKLATTDEVGDIVARELEAVLRAMPAAKGVING